PAVCAPAPCANARGEPAGPSRAAPAKAPAAAGGAPRRPAPRLHRAGRACRGRCRTLPAPCSGRGVLRLAALAARGDRRFAIVPGFVRGGDDRRHPGAQLGLEAFGHRHVLLQVLAGVLLALADALVAVAVPGTRLLHEPGIHAHVDQLALAADALAVEDLGDDLLERRRHLVLDHLDAGLVADDFIALLDRADAADVQAHRGVELERVAAGGGLRALARHHD